MESLVSLIMVVVAITFAVGKGAAKRQRRGSSSQREAVEEQRRRKAAWQAQQGRPQNAPERSAPSVRRLYRDPQHSEPLYRKPQNSEPLYKQPEHDEPLYKQPRSRDPLYKQPHHAYTPQPQPTAEAKVYSGGGSMEAPPPLVYQGLPPQQDAGMAAAAPTQTAQTPLQRPSAAIAQPWRGLDLGRDALIRGLVMAEILDKPLALRRKR